jgi:uncharacterized protein YuzE
VQSTPSESAVREAVGMIRVKYDERANAAYIYLLERAVKPSVAKSYPCDPIEVGGMINLDFDQDGRLIGVEVLAARSKLPLELLSGDAPNADPS